MPVTFVAADANNSGNVTAITGLDWPDTNADDLAIFLGAAISSATLTLDSTLTAERTDIDQNLKGLLAKRLPAPMDGTETGAITMSAGTTTNRMAAAVGIYRNATGIGTAVYAAEGSTAVTTHTSPDPTLASADDAIVLLYAERQSLGVPDITPPAGYTRRIQYGTGGSGGTAVCIADKLTGNSAGSNTVGTWTSTQAASNVTMYAIPVIAAASSADQGTLVASFSAAVASMVGDASIAADLVAAFSAAVASATGAATADGTLAASFSSPAVAGAGDVFSPAVLSGSFSSAGVQLTGDASDAGQIGGAFAAPTLSGAATGTADAALTGTFAAPTLSGAGQSSAEALLAGVFATVEASFAGQTVDEVDRGTLAGSFAAVQLAAGGEALSRGQVVGAFAAPSVQLSADGSAQGGIVGTFSAATISLTGSISGVPRDVDVVILRISDVGAEVFLLDEPDSVTIVKSTDVFTTIGGIDVRDQWRKGTKEFIDFVATVRDRAGEMTLIEAQALNYKIAVTAGDETFPSEPTDIRFITPSVTPEVVQAQQNGVDIPGQFDVTIRHLYEATETGLHRVWLTFGPTPEEPILIAAQFVSL